MGMFDDLIPSGAPKSAGMFDDLIPNASGPLSVPADAKPGPQGLLWNTDGGYDPQTGELVVGGKPFSEPSSSRLLAGVTGAVSGVPIAGPALQTGVEKAAAGIKSATTGTPYDQNLSAAKSVVERSQAENPGTTILGNVGGAVLGSLAGAEALDTLGGQIGSRALGLVGSPPGRTAQGMVGGALIGGADANARGQSPEGGALAGLAAGAAAPLVGGVAERLGNWIMNGAQTLPGVYEGVNSAGRNILDQALQGTPQAAIDRGTQRLGPYGMVGELTPRLQSKLAGIGNSGDAGEEIVQQAFHNRDVPGLAPPGGIGPVTGPRPRIEGALTEAFGPTTNIVTQNAADIAARRAAANPLYTAWRNTPVPMTPELTTLLDNPWIRDAMPRAQHLAEGEGNSLLNAAGQPTSQTWDYIKRSLDGGVERSLRGSNPDANSARIYSGLRGQLLDAIDNHPDPNIAGIWRQARQAWADPSSIMEARTLGQSAFDSARNYPANQLADDIANMSAPQKTAYNEGARDQVQQVMDATRRGDTAARSMLLSPAGQQKLALTVGPDRATALIRSLEQEEALKFSNAATIGGSQTGGRTADIAGVKPPAPSGKGLAGWWNAVRLDAPSAITGIIPRLRDNYLNQLYEQGREQVAPILTTPIGGNEHLINQLLAGTEQRGRTAATASNLNDLATLLMNTAGNQQGREVLSPYAPTMFPR